MSFSVTTRAAYIHYHHILPVIQYAFELIYQHLLWFSGQYTSL